MRNPISVIILTYSEELNLENCLKNIFGWADEIFIVDSYSTDKTLEIAKKYNCKIFQHPFENQAQQFNWALDNLKIKNEWILRLDADEYLTPELKDEITKTLKNTSDNISGYYMKRRVYFMGKWIKHGGYYPTWILRLFRYDKGKSELRKVDEHIVLTEGEASRLKNDFADDNKKDLTWWIGKHNDYASREAADFLSGNLGVSKKRYYYALPMFFRAFLYFIYRYLFRLGFLDGKRGLMFHFFQGFWYRFLIDAKIYETKTKSPKN